MDHQLSAAPPLHAQGSLMLHHLGGIGELSRLSCNVDMFDWVFDWANRREGDAPTNLISFDIYALSSKTTYIVLLPSFSEQQQKLLQSL